MLRIGPEFTLRDPEKKAYYQRMAKKLKLPNAYTAAITDYMRKGEIKEIDTRRYKGNAGDVIRVKAHKKDFTIGTVKITLCGEAGNIIESGKAVMRHGFFIYKTCTTLPEKIPVKLNVSLSDQVISTVERDVQILF